MTIKKVISFLILFGVLSTFSAFAKEVIPPDYFPLQVGYWWKYKLIEKNMEFTIKVTATETINSISCFKVETIVGDKTSFIDYYAKSEGFVWIYKTVYPESKMEAIYEPTAKKYLKIVLNTADTWGWKGKGMMGVDIESNDNVDKSETVEVPAGKFSTMRVLSKIIQGGQEVEKGYWYAPNVGLVKSHTNSSGIESTAVLVKYNLVIKAEK